MAEDSSPVKSPSPAHIIPQKRPLAEDDAHAPAISSPLNPDFAASRARKAAAAAGSPAPGPPVREQREKKESLKKREAKGENTARTTTSDSATPSRGSKKKEADTGLNSHGLIRYTIPLPKIHDFDPPGPPALLPSLTRGGREFYESQEHVYNRKGFRYTHCIADPRFQFSQYHRQTEVEPFVARFEYEDSSSHIRFDWRAKAVTTEKGFRMARANVGIREGRWYWEYKILSGVKNPEDPNPPTDGPGGHVRMGISRREAPLETPVGWDAYSYGLRDVAGQKVHKSRPQDFLPPGESICEGDVIGLQIQLPSLSLHRKVVDGTYNKAVDAPNGEEVDIETTAEGPNIVRDRLPIRYRNHVYFEQFEYAAVKEVEELTYPSSTSSATATASSAAAAQPPNPNHPIVALRTLPSSSIRVYKNGKDMGILYKDLLAFLPLASKPAVQSGVVGAREGLDDGTLGYYPSVSVFQGGAAEANFGPNFWFPPDELKDAAGDVNMTGIDLASRQSMFSLRRLRPLCERYEEQIAEDITFDIIDEVDLWFMDGGKLDEDHADQPNGNRLQLVPGDVNGADEMDLDPHGGSEQARADGLGVKVRTGDLNEIVQDDE
ncbi:MAG: hypothetical protein GOMPHAMPRED_002682 [Gomphillus americanus]|uniref:B30.2/SPRY domain-containing protein n=1 Tax=Gomphillus americanus TaxID=1940652 RepID=A0A8H3FKU2_9LECA|nr:MAG: hypothetical protein GOMPHAMPRED_002682 [Gomphillus americanus]